MCVQVANVALREQTNILIVVTFNPQNFRNDEGIVLE